MSQNISTSKVGIEFCVKILEKKKGNVYMVKSLRDRKDFTDWTPIASWKDHSVPMQFLPRLEYMYRVLLSPVLTPPLLLTKTISKKGTIYYKERFNINYCVSKVPWILTTCTLERKISFFHTLRELVVLYSKL